MTATKPASKTTGVVLSSIANPLRRGGDSRTADPETVFRRHKGVEVVTRLLRETGLDPEKNAYHVTILAHFTRSTRYPTISGVTLDVPYGVQFRFKPEGSDGFSLRLVVGQDSQLSAEQVATRLKLTAARLYGHAPAEPAETPPVETAWAAVKSLLDLKYTSADRAAWAAVKSLLDLKYTSADRAAWAGAVAQEVGPNEAPEQWAGALAELVRTGRLFRSDATGYVMPAALPAKIPDVPAAAVVRAADLTVAPAPETRAPGPDTLAGELFALLGRLSTCHADFNAAQAAVTDAEWAVCDSRQKIDRMKAELAAEEELLARRQETLAAKKAAQDASLNGIDTDTLVALAAQLEAARRPAASTQPTTEVL